MSLYKDLLKKGKEALDEAKIPFKVRKSEKELEVKIIEIESQIADIELELQEAKSSDPLNFNKILEASDKLKLKNRELELANSLKEELFGK